MGSPFLGWLESAPDDPSATRGGTAAGKALGDCRRSVGLRVIQCCCQDEFKILGRAGFSEKKPLSVNAAEGEQGGGCDFGFNSFGDDP
jgi:hypothetical protein